MSGFLNYYREEQLAKQYRTVLKTGLTPSASGSAYLEIELSTEGRTTTKSLATPSSSLKLSCTIHGPKPLPRSATFSSSLQISTYVKLAPFAAQHRRGYIRDSRERDLSVHLETALKAVIAMERWPKSRLDIVVTVLEGEDDGDYGDGVPGAGGTPGWGMMNVLAGCITVASAALTDARVDCLDLISGGVAAIVENGDVEGQRIGTKRTSGSRANQVLVLDPCPSEHRKIVAACVVAYLACSDEITEMWLKGDVPYGKRADDGNGEGLDELIGGAVDAASASRTVLEEAVRESAELLVESLVGGGKGTSASTKEGRLRGP